MRNYQTKSNKGALPDSITATRFGAGEFNSVAVELEGAVTTSGQSLAPADGTGEVTDQLAMALAIYGAGGATYHLDTGAVNAYVLTPVSPKESPNDYFDGFTVVFEPGTQNTGASTVNVNSLGIKSITDKNGNALVGGEIQGTVCIKFNATDNRFEFMYNNTNLSSFVFPELFGAVADGVRLDDAAITTGTDDLSSASASFTSADVGKIISVMGAGSSGNNLVSTIASVTDANNIVLSDNASTTVASAYAAYGTDCLSAIDTALDTGKNVFINGRYCISDELAITDGRKLIGGGCFNRTRDGYDYMDYDVTVIIYCGETTTNSTAVRVSEKAVGVVGSDFTPPDTDDLLDFRFNNLHVDAMRADFGIYFYRCGSNSGVDRITVEHAKDYNLVGLGLYTVRWGFIGSYASYNTGAIFGFDLFSWGTEYKCYACKIEFQFTSNGLDGQFIEDDATYDEFGAGGIFSMGRGCVLGIQSEKSDGRPFIIEPFQAPATYNVIYTESNGAGPLIRNYNSSSRGMTLRYGFIHTDEDIKILADSDDDGPARYNDWIVIENIFAGATKNINSNTYKYRVVNCDSDTTFLDQYPAPDNQERNAGDILRNGQFAVWQTGTSFSSDGYGPDQWILDLQGATGTLTRQNLALDALEGVDKPNPKYFARLQTTVASADSGISQKMPDVRNYSNNRIVISFWAKCAASTTMRLTYRQFFGTGGSPSSTVEATIDDITIGTSWRRYVRAIDIPDISAATIGTNGDDYFALRIRRQTAATFTFDSTCWQIDTGSYGAKSFRVIPDEIERINCMQYFQRVCSTNTHFITNGQCTSTTSAFLVLQFPVPMWQIPTLTVSAAGDFSLTGATGTNNAASSITISNADKISGQLSVSVASGLVSGNATALRSTSSSATFDLDARL